MRTNVSRPGSVVKGGEQGKERGCKDGKGQEGRIKMIEWEAEEDSGWDNVDSIE